MHTNDSPVCVVGAGILGLSTAVHLARAGVRDITVLDTGGPLAGTTPAGAGFVAAFAADTNRRLDPAMIDVAQYGIDFYTALDRAGADIEFSANGNVVLATTSATLEAAVAGIVGHPRRLPGTRRLTPRDVAELSGGCVDPDAIVGGVLMAEGVQVTTGLVCAALLEELACAGVRVQFETEVTGLELRDDAVVGVRTVDGVVPTGRVVLACGAWTNDLLRPLGWSLPVVPVVATRFVTADCGVPPDMPSAQCLDLGLWLRELRGGFSWGTGMAYRGVNALRADGVVIGHGRPDVPSLVARQRNVQPDVARVFPLLGELEPVEVFQGMPVYSSDGNFFAGPLPHREGVWVVAGDNESGVTHGPGIGRLLADLVTGASPIFDPTPYRLDRVGAAEFPDDESVIASLSQDRIASVFA